MWERGFKAPLLPPGCLTVLCFFHPCVSPAGKSSSVIMLRKKTNIFLLGFGKPLQKTHKSWKKLKRNNLHVYSNRTLLQRHLVRVAENSMMSTSSINNAGLQKTQDVDVMLPLACFMITLLRCTVYTF